MIIDMNSLLLVGEGSEGAVFTDGKGFAYKVGKHLLEDEALALKVAYEGGAPVPEFYSYSRTFNVIAREFIEGECCTEQEAVRGPFREVVKALKGFTPPEFALDSFIKKATGEVIMVDLGMAHPQ